MEHSSQELKWLTVKSGSGWRSEEGEEGGQRDEGVEEACRDEQHHQLGGQGHYRPLQSNITLKKVRR